MPEERAALEAMELNVRERESLGRENQRQPREGIAAAPET
jgi:hypothetical protein